MKFLNKQIIVAAVLALSPLTAFAAGNFYLGGSIGSASLSEDFDGYDVDSSSTAFRLVAGWQFNDYFSLEGGYHNFGSFEQQFDIGGQPVDISLKADGFLLGGTGTLPLTEKFALFGRAGSFFWDGDADINNATEATPGDTNLYIGAGARFTISDRVAIAGDWVSYNLEDTRSDVASIGVIVSF
tara:strand:- start:3139 stop:3690 length:552 start_codon:yes stop_codon:yes gene_type:complete